MKGKKGGIDFSLSTLLHFIMGTLVTVLLISAVWTFWGPQETAEASTKTAMDDILLKLGNLKEGQSVIASGYVDKGAMIIGFNSNQARLGASKAKCYSIAYSCICACKGDNCEKVLECKAFSGDKISRIVKDEGQLRLNGGNYGKAFTLRMALSGTALSMEDVK